MSGDLLALGAVAALAAAGLRRRGSRADDDPTITRCGFPWPRDYTLYHATTGLRAIRRQGFRPRRQVGTSALGGGTDEAISFTLDPRVAKSIVIGLLVLRAGARGDLTLTELYEHFEEQYPDAIRSFNTTFHGRTSATHTTRADLAKIDAGYRMISPGLFDNRGLPQGAIPIGEGWQGRDRTYYHRWWQKYANEAERREWEVRRGELFKDLYATLLAAGDDAHASFNPVFWNPSLDVLAQLDLDDIGILVATINIDRVCMGAMSAVQAGYLERPVAKFWDRELSRYRRDCVRPLSGYGRKYPESYSLFEGGRYPRDKQIGPFRLDDVGEPGPSTTTEYLWALSELRVFDPSRITVVSSQASQQALSGFEGLVAYPWFDSMDLRAARPELPGDLVLGR